MTSNAGEGRSRRLPLVDHLVWGGRDLDRQIDDLETRLGVRAAPGGSHPGQGTRNALIGLGPSIYLELVGPDPGQPRPAGPRWFGLDDLAGSRLVTWAAKVADLEGRVAAAGRGGLGLGQVLTGERRQPGGQMLRWRYTYPDLRLGDGLVPFLIDWGESPHPAERAPAGVALLNLRAEHPAPEAIHGLLRRLGIDLQVSSGPRPALIASLQTPGGQIELR